PPAPQNWPEWAAACEDLPAYPGARALLGGSADVARLTHDPPPRFVCDSVDLLFEVADVFAVDGPDHGGVSELGQAVCLFFGEGKERQLFEVADLERDGVVEGFGYLAVHAGVERGY